MSEPLGDQRGVFWTLDLTRLDSGPTRLDSGLTRLDSQLTRLDSRLARLDVTQKKPQKLTSFDDVVQK